MSYTSIPLPSVISVKGIFTVLSPDLSRCNTGKTEAHNFPEIFYLEKGLFPLLPYQGQSLFRNNHNPQIRDYATDCRDNVNNTLLCTPISKGFPMHPGNDLRNPWHIVHNVWKGVSCCFCKPLTSHRLRSKTTRPEQKIQKSEVHEETASGPIL